MLAHTKRERERMHPFDKKGIQNFRHLDVLRHKENRHPNAESGLVDIYISIDNLRQKVLKQRGEKKSKVHKHQ